MKNTEGRDEDNRSIHVINDAGTPEDCSSGPKNKKVGAALSIFYFLKRTSRALI